MKSKVMVIGEVYTLKTNVFILFVIIINYTCIRNKNFQLNKKNNVYFSVISYNYIQLERHINMNKNIQPT